MFAFQARKLLAFYYQQHDLFAPRLCCNPGFTDTPLVKALII